MAFNSLLRQTISVKNPSGSRDLHAKTALGAATEHRARFERTYKTIVTAEREREPIHGIIFTKSDATIEIGAQVTYSGEVYRVMQRDDVVGKNGSVHHYEFLVQLWSWS
jgi:hypothetical protein